MDRLIIRLAINALALYAVIGTGWIPEIQAENTAWWAFVILGVIFAAVNALVRPILKLLTCPLILLTLGLFTLVINAAVFLITGWIGRFVGIGFEAPFGWAFVAGIIVGVINTVLSLVFRENQ